MVGSTVPKKGDLNGKRESVGGFGPISSARSPRPPIRCPECGSTKLFKDGLRYLSDGSSVQRWLCRTCFYRFTDPEHKALINKYLKNNNAENEAMKRAQIPQAHDSAKAVYALTEETPTTTVTVKRETTQQDAKGKIVELLWNLEKNGRGNVTTENYRKFLNSLLKHGLNLFNPEELKGYIAKARWSTTSKIAAVRKLNVWFRFLKIPWEAPKYTPETTIPFIPTEEELNQLIAAVGKKTACYLELLLETGARPGEISKLSWTDIDFERRTVRIKPEKGSLPRILPLSVKAIEMLNSLPRKSDKMFPPVQVMEPTFRYQRNKLAKKLCNPRLQQITFKTFRHWKGTMEYHKTKDPIHVKQILGHKDLKSTQVYIHVENAIFGVNSNDDFHVKVASTKEEITGLLEAGFEYVFTHEGLAYFRKRR
jgi:integrase